MLKDEKKRCFIVDYCCENKESKKNTATKYKELYGTLKS